MKSELIKVQFHPPKSGWIDMVVSWKGRDFPVYTSNVFDPYPSFLDWLECLAKGNLPCTWYIYEEGSFMEFSVHVDESGHTRLKMVGDRIGEELLDEGVTHTFIDERVDAKEIARAFYTGFREMMSKVSDESAREKWGANLRGLPWERVESLLW